MKDFKSLPQYGNRSKKFVNRYKANNRVAILKDKQVFALCTATLTFVPNDRLSLPPNRYFTGMGRINNWYEPYIAPITPRRNAKCSCGSGLKYKKCCMK